MRKIQRGHSDFALLAWSDHRGRSQPVFYGDIGAGREEDTI